MRMPFHHSLASFLLPFFLAFLMPIALKIMHYFPCLTSPLMLFFFIMNCLFCSTPFTPTRFWKQFCSKKCQTKHWHREKGAKFDTASHLSDDPRTGVWLAQFPESIRYSPFVYGWHRKSTYLYIGATSNGCPRLTSHHTLDSVLPVVSTDNLHIWLVEPSLIALLEAKLISDYKPPFNTIYPSLDVITFSIPQPITVSLSLPLCPYCAKPFTPSGGGAFRLFCCGEHLKLHQMGYLYAKR